MQSRYLFQSLLLTIGLLVFGSLLAGCDQGENQTAQSSPSPQIGAAITPYATATLAIPPTATVSILPTQTPPPLPTPTPYLYTVVANDTMIGIASYFGITLDELMVANPDVSPNALSIGTQLVIPLTLDDTGEDPASTGAEILAMETGEVFCYAVRSGGAWCYWPVSNPYDQPVENLSAILNLTDDQNEVAASQAAMSLVNVLSPGSTIPLIAYFPPPLANWTQAQGQLTGAIYANQYNDRYLTASVEQFTTVPVSSASGEESQGMDVSGILRYTPASAENPTAPEYAWVVAVAYDADGAVVGVRRWEAPQINPGEVLNFNFEVYTLGKPIEQVEILVEVPASGS